MSHRVVTKALFLMVLSCDTPSSPPLEPESIEPESVTTETSDGAPAIEGGAADLEAASTPSPNPFVPFPEEARTRPDEAIALGEGVHMSTIREARPPPGQTTALTPAAGDEVDIRFSSWTSDGEFIDGVGRRGPPRRFAMDRVPQAWRLALEAMQERQVALVWAPPGTTHEDDPADTSMVYQLELFGVDRQLAPPVDPSTPAADAIRTPSGLGYVILRRGDGETRPTSRAEVQIHQTGWTADGEMLSTTRVRDHATTIRVNSVIPGWTEILQLLHEGDQARIWVPEQLAYQGRDNHPMGDLMYDIELVSILQNPPPPPTAPSGSPEPESVRVRDGVDYRLLSGRGASDRSPALDDWVRLRTIAWTQEGRYVNGTDLTGEPISARVRDLCPAWQSVLSSIHEGESVRIWSSAEESRIGRRAAPAIVADVELIEIGPIPPTPEHVNAPPDAATITDSGLAYQVIESGDSETRPNEDSTVVVHYSGWTTDGDLFESSTRRMEPARIPLTRLMEGWQEGLRLMVEGQTNRFWIPEELAHGGQPGRPSGMLVYEIELLEID